MKTYAVDLHRIAVYVKADATIETFIFKSRRQADKKIHSLNAAGYTFDRMMYALEVRPTTAFASLRNMVYAACPCGCGSKEVCESHRANVKAHNDAIPF